MSEVSSTERLWVGTRTALAAGGGAGVGWLVGEALGKHARRGSQFARYPAATGAMFGAVLGGLVWGAATARPDPEASPQLQVTFP